MPELSIIVVTYKMQREAPRTIHSLLPPAQRLVNGLDYELVVVDNGSPEPLNLEGIPTPGRQFVHLVRIDPGKASVSPAACINHVVRKYTSGERILICIDGARLASSHLVRRTVDVLARYPDAFTYVASRHLGPKPQMQSVKEGYDQTAEDKLLESVPWQTDLDELYNISVWAGAHDPINPLAQNESNAFAMARTNWDSIGGYNEGFSRPGGGLCNLEIFSKIVNRKDGLNILLWGESTFHQVHSGAATSNSGYFGESLAEFLQVTGKIYSRPSYRFLADLGEEFDRLKKLNQFLFAQGSRA